MAMAFQHQKDLEARVHEALYTNIELLTYSYPAPKEFIKVFKRDMFVKNNSAAFHQVIHYLLNILDSELTKKMVPTWPLYDKKLENKFRKEIVVYIEQLNDIYDHANLPKLMASNFISPGGFKFARFMFKLSQLVLYEHLKKMDDLESELLVPPSFDKDLELTDLAIATLKRKTKCVNDKIKEMMTNFDVEYTNLQGQARDVVQQHREVYGGLSKAKVLLAEQESNVKGKTYEEMQAKIEDLQGKIATLEDIANLFVDADKLLTYVSSEEPVLECNKVPDSIAKEIQLDNGKIDLKRLFYCVNTCLERTNLPGYSMFELGDLKDLVVHLKERYTLIESKLSHNQSQLSELVGSFNQTFGNL